MTLIAALWLEGCQASGPTQPPELPTIPVDRTPRDGPPPPGEIAFTTDRDGNLEVYVMNADGSDPRNLTRHPAADYSPAWSPDGERIAFLSDRSGIPEVYVMGADGFGPAALTPDVEGSTWTRPLRWSPSRTELLAPRTFQFNENWANVEIQVVQADGTGFQPLYPGYRVAHNDFAAEWLPSGDQVDFLSFRYTTRSLFTVDLAGGTPRNLFAAGSGNVLGFAGSPDGEELALVTSTFTFGRRQFETRTNLERMVRATGQRMAVPDAAFLSGLGEFEIAWSPQSDRVAFAAQRTREHSELWMWFVTFPGDLDRNLAPLTDMGGVHGWPSWSADGRWVAFASDAGGDDEVYILQVGNSPAVATDPAWRLLQLSATPGADTEPAWRPGGAVAEKAAPRVAPHPRCGLRNCPV